MGEKLLLLKQERLNFSPSPLCRVVGINLKFSLKNPGHYSSSGSPWPCGPWPPSWPHCARSYVERGEEGVISTMGMPLWPS